MNLTPLEDFINQMHGKKGTWKRFKFDMHIWYMLTCYRIRRKLGLETDEE